jgi:hypothetical protein
MNHDDPRNKDLDLYPLFPIVYNCALFNALNQVSGQNIWAHHRRVLKLTIQYYEFFYSILLIVHTVTC